MNTLVQHASLSSSPRLRRCGVWMRTGEWSISSKAILGEVQRRITMGGCGLCSRERRRSRCGCKLGIARILTATDCHSILRRVPFGVEPMPMKSMRPLRMAAGSALVGGGEFFLCQKEAVSCFSGPAAEMLLPVFATCSDRQGRPKEGEVVGLGATNLNWLRELTLAPSKGVARLRPIAHLVPPTKVLQYDRAHSRISTHCSRLLLLRGRKPVGLPALNRSQYKIACGSPLLSMRVALTRAPRDSWTVARPGPAVVTGLSAKQVSP